MKILVVDDEEIALKNLMYTIKKYSPSDEAVGFDVPYDAIKYVSNNEIDVALLDINMRKITGLELASGIKKLIPDCAIIFVTGYSEYALKAFEIKASGYLLKPVDKDSLLKELDYVRNNIMIKNEKEKRVSVQCFGNFEVFIDKKPVNFKFSKSKEMFAYLIDRRGALCSNNEIIATVWDEDITDSYFRTIRLDMLNSLPEEIFSRQRGKIGINRDEISCDFYDFLYKNKKFESYEYMTQYSWGEETLGEIYKS